MGAASGFTAIEDLAYRTATAPKATLDRTIGHRPYRCHCHRTYQHRDICILEVDTGPTSIITDTDPFRLLASNLVRESGWGDAAEFCSTSGSGDGPGLASLMGPTA
jgi:hypothetical protein